LAYWDSMTDHARSLALDKGGMPDSWRYRLPPCRWSEIRDICEGQGAPYAPSPRASIYERD